MSAYDYEIREAKRRARGDNAPYTTGFNHEGKPAVLGPGLSYYQPTGGLTEEQAKYAAVMCNEAYRCGFNQARYDIQQVLGIKTR
jgi:hypothetical protein